MTYYMYSLTLYKESTLGKVLNLVSVKGFIEVYRLRAIIHMEICNYHRTKRIEIPLKQIHRPITHEWFQTRWCQVGLATCSKIMAARIILSHEHISRYTLME